MDDERKRFRFYVKNKKLESIAKVNKGFLSTQKSKRMGADSGKINARIEDVIRFIKEKEKADIEFIISENLYKIGPVCYTRNQLLYRANKMRQYLGLKKFIIE